MTKITTVVLLLGLVFGIGAVSLQDGSKSLELNSCTDPVVNTTLQDCSDVDDGTPTTGYVLYWDGDSWAWKNASDVGGPFTDAGTRLYPTNGEDLQLGVNQFQLATLNITESSNVADKTARIFLGEETVSDDGWYIQVDDGTNGNLVFNDQSYDRFTIPESRTGAVGGAYLGQVISYSVSPGNAASWHNAGSLTLCPYGNNYCSTLRLHGTGGPSYTQGALLFYAEDSGVNDGEIGRIVVNASSGDIDAGFMYFGCSNNVGTSSYQLTIDGVNDRVGINNITPSYPLDVVGNAYFSANVSADSFTDRSKIFTGDALEAISSITSEVGLADADGFKEVDHDSLPAGVKVTRLVRKITNKSTLEKKNLGEWMYENGVKDEKELQAYLDSGDYIVAEEYEDGRDLGKMIQVNTRALQQLLDRVEALEAQLKAK